MSGGDNGQNVGKSPEKSLEGREPFRPQSERHTLRHAEPRCSEGGERGMSLPIRKLTIEPSVLRRLEHNPWSDRFERAELVANGRAASARIRCRGGHTRSYSKQSYELRSGGYTWHYNAEYDDPSMIRNALSFAFFPLIGVPAPRTEHVILVVNGEPRGVYLEIESVGRAFFRRRRIGAAALFYAVNDRANFGLYSPDSGIPKKSLLAGYEFRFGGSGERQRLVDFIRRLNVARSAAAVERLAAAIDVDAYFHWLAGAVLTGNYDGFEQNYAIFRSARSGKYRLMPWDYEGTWGRNCYGKPADVRQVSVAGYNELTRKLLGHCRFRGEYKAILRKALHRVFTTERIMTLADRMLARIAPDIREDRTRKWSYAQFVGESAVIRRYVRERREVVRRELSRL